MISELFIFWKRRKCCGLCNFFRNYHEQENNQKKNNEGGEMSNATTPPEGTKAYQKKVKDVTENFHQNAMSVQEMINGAEQEIFGLLKKKEKLREKLIKMREEKRL